MIDEGIRNGRRTSTALSKVRIRVSQERAHKTKAP